MNLVIVGAGIGGLTLAAALAQTAPDVHVEIYERDESAWSGSRGHALGLKGDGALPVLDRLGLRERVLGSGAIPVTDFVFTDQQGRTLLVLPARDERHMTFRVQRESLKEALLETIGAMPIHYGRACVGVERGPTGPVLSFEGGAQVDADCVVACDGVGSVIRQQLVGDEKRSLGLTAVAGFAPGVIEHPLLDGGYFMTLGRDGASVFAYRQPGGVHFSYTSHAAPEVLLNGLTRDELAQRLESDTAGWHPLIPRLVAAADVRTLEVRGYYDKQPVRTVQHRDVWLIGDAAHPMSPFQGQGANMAMVDALALADHIAGAVPAAEVDADIVARGRKAVLDSRRAAAQFHTRSAFNRFNRDVGLRVANRMIRVFTPNRTPGP